MTNADQPARKINGEIDTRTTPEKFADLWIAVNMPEMKPRSIIPLIKRAYMAGHKSKESELSWLKVIAEKMKDALNGSDRLNDNSKDVREALTAYAEYCKEK